MYREDEKLLTEREIEVLICLHKGLSNPEISRNLCITVSTVKAHISNIFQKLHAKGRFDVLMMLVGEKTIVNEDIKKQINSLNGKLYSKK